MHISCYDTVTTIRATILGSGSITKLFLLYYYGKKMKTKTNKTLCVTTLTASSLQRMITEQIVIHGPSRSERRINAVDTMSCP